MIKKDSYEFNTFVGLRVKEIDAKSDVTAWCHISSSNNYCADILTRGETPDKLGPGSAWQSGPAWLTQDPETWPVTEVVPTKEERNVLKSFERVTKSALAKDKNLLLVHKIVRRMKSSKCKIVGGQFFEKAANLWPH